MKGNKKANKKLGQNFLVCREVAKKEAEFAIGKKVIEIGPGKGILTKELCSRANSVLTVELDNELYNTLSLNMDQYNNIKLINADFFSLEHKNFDGYDMLISNIPYKLSSKTIDWIMKTGIESVLCIQKEFAEHMLAKPSTRKYSKLSVISQLFLDVYIIASVPRTCFSPKPKIDSTIIHIKRNNVHAVAEELYILSALMTHKKKTLHNAIMDSRKEFQMAKESLTDIAKAFEHNDKRVFKMEPGELLEISRKLASAISAKRSIAEK